MLIQVITTKMIMHSSTLNTIIRCTTILGNIQIHSTGLSIKVLQQSEQPIGDYRPTLVGRSLPNGNSLNKNVLGIIRHSLFLIVVDPNEINLLRDNLHIKWFYGEIDMQFLFHRLGVTFSEQRKQIYIGKQRSRKFTCLFILNSPGCRSRPARIERCPNWC